MLPTTRRVLLALLTISLGTVTLVKLTQSFFSDTETSTGNTFQAGAIDLKVDNTSYYNGILNPGTTWESDDLPGHLFFNFSDLKPSDLGEDTISLLVQNDAWACMSITKTEDNDATCTEPESTDDLTCQEPNVDLFDGELGGLVNFAFWADDGDNVYEDNEIIFKSGTASALFDGSTWTLADSASSIWPTPGPLPANTTKYIGKAWCFGTLTPAAVAQGANSPTVNSGFTCNGAALNNASQTDVLKADVQFTAIQSRNNTNYLCTPDRVTPTPTIPVITPTVTITPTPTPLACQQADVILVLDRSGSINSTELSQLKTAAKDFVDALGLTTTGIHGGMTSFATTGSLDHHLDENSVALKNSIDALLATGFTNLSEGINLATTEFANPGDGHDRPDLTSPDKLIVITDGNPNRPFPTNTASAVAATAADNARAAGIEIYAVGVGVDVDATYLQNDIANPGAGHYFSVADYSGLQTTLQNLDLCQ